MATLSDTASLGILTRLQEAINDHDLDGFTACFAERYRAEIPAHPQRSFGGSEQVRRNWAQILGSVAGMHATLRGSIAAGRFTWGEWLWTGTRVDGAAFAMAGVTILEIDDESGQIVSSRFYMEPVETSSGDVTADVGRVTGRKATTR